MIPLSQSEEASRARVYERMRSKETFRVIGLVGINSFSDPLYRWEVYRYLCFSSEYGYVQAKETHQFPGDCWSEPAGPDSFFSFNLVDLTQEEADQYRFILRKAFTDQPFRKPPLAV